MSKVTCGHAFIEIRRECVTYFGSVGSRPRSFNINIGPARGKARPEYSDAVAEHIRSCEYCQDIQTLLSRWNLPDGSLVVKSNMEENTSDGEPYFTGTPSSIIAGLSSYYLPPKKDGKPNATALATHVCRDLHLPVPVDEANKLDSKRFLKILIDNMYVEIEADPWFIVSSIPEDLIVTED